MLARLSRFEEDRSAAFLGWGRLRVNPAKRNGE
jgi:hypothetical protein